MFSNKHPLKIAIIGINGKMGKEIVNQAVLTENIAVVCGIVGKNSPMVGKSISVPSYSTNVAYENTNNNNSIPIFSLETISSSNLDVQIDCIIDFSSISALEENILYAKTNKIPFLSGVTGISPKDTSLMLEASKEIPVLWSANMSFGIHALLSSLTSLTKILGNTYDIEISEIHHRNKKDIPSGTAKLLASSIKEGRNNNEDFSFKVRNEGIYENGRGNFNEVGIASIRGGDVNGEHTVYFLGDGERIEIKHIATTRANFANGAIKGGLWLAKQKPAFYSMKDVIFSFI